MRIYHLFIGCAIALLLQSCDKAHPVPVDKKEYVSKKAEVFLEGNQDEIYPWLSFSAHTDNGKPIYLENGNDKMAFADGQCLLNWGEFPKSGRLVLRAEGTAPVTMHVGVTYRKRKETEPPVESELLTVRIKGYADDVQVLDTTRLMRSFYAKELIMPDNYMFHVSF